MHAGQSAGSKIAVSEDAPTDFNAIQQLCTRCQARKRFDSFPPKNCGPSRNEYGTPLRSTSILFSSPTYLANASGPRTEPHGAGAGTPLHFDDACVVSLCPLLSVSLSFTLAVGWAGRAIVKFNQGNLYASIAYRDKLT